MITIGRIIGSICIVLIGVSLLSANSFGSSTKPASCVPTKNLDQEMAKRFNERPFFRGISMEGYYVMMYFNRSQRTWTVFGIHPTQPNSACPLAAGSNGEILNPKGQRL